MTQLCSIVGAKWIIYESIMTRREFAWTIMNNNWTSSFHHAVKLNIQGTFKAWVSSSTHRATTYHQSNFSCHKYHWSRFTSHNQPSRHVFLLFYQLSLFLRYLLMSLSWSHKLKSIIKSSCRFPRNGVLCSASFDDKNVFSFVVKSIGGNGNRLMRCTFNLAFHKCRCFYLALKFVAWISD